MNQLDSQTAYWNAVAAQKTFTHPIDLAMLEKCVSKNDCIIDYGCGYGRLLSILNNAGYNNVQGFDTSNNLIERGKENGINSIFYIDSLTVLPVADNSVDCILLFAVLTCIPANSAQTALINTLYSKLKKGGIIYISDYYLQENSAEMERYEYLNNDKQNEGVFTLPEGAVFRHHSKEWISFLLKEFIIEKEIQMEVQTMNGHKAQAFQLIAKKIEK